MVLDGNLAEINVKIQLNLLFLLVVAVVFIHLFSYKSFLQFKHSRLETSPFIL